jgi:voltage-gated potassium channel
MNVHVTRLLTGTALVGGVVVAGGAWIWVLGDGRWSVAEALYMAVISAATVGFSELPGYDAVPGARLAAVVTIFAGLGAFAYAQSSLTAFLLEGLLGEAFRRKRMTSSIAKLDRHVVVAGAGATGRHVIEELVATETPFVVIDRSRPHVERLVADFAPKKVLFVVGDATEDSVLLEAGVDRASGVIAALTHDQENLYVSLSARSLNAKARIIAKVVEAEAVPKMLRAGANGTVSPNTIGGRRLAAELLRPTVVEFLDVMLRDKHMNMRFEEVEVPAGSPWANRTIAEGPFRRETNTLVVGVREPGGAISYNPPADRVLRPGTIVIVLGQAADVQRLRRILRGESASAA